MKAKGSKRAQEFVMASKLSLHAIYFGIFRLNPKQCNCEVIEIS